eukprot:9484267-Pyramimonas_sp.AAC.1
MALRGFGTAQNSSGRTPMLRKRPVFPIGDGEQYVFKCPWRSKTFALPPSSSHVGLATSALLEIAQTNLKKSTTATKQPKERQTAPKQ